jgi:hypothetical protein
MSEASSSDCVDPKHRKKGYCNECEGCRKCPPPSKCSGWDHLPRVKRSSTSNDGSPAKRNKTSPKRQAKKLANKKIKKQFQQEEQEDDETDHQEKTITIQDLFDFLGMSVPEKIGATLLINDVKEKTISNWGNCIELIVNRILDICVVGNVNKMKSELAK